MDYSIKIDEFEGPLDLLLHLIKQSNIDIQNIEINKITKQYLDYLNKMEELNINIASSYLVMAAELLEIKSKSLLPTEENELDDDSEETVTRENLINKLLEYQKYKEMTPRFKELESNRKNIYIKSPSRIDNYIDKKINNNHMNLDDLVKAFELFLERLDKEKPLNTKITNKEYSVKDRKKEIKSILKEKGHAMFTELFKSNNKPFIIVTFLSLLEMTKESEIVLKQDNNFQDILIELRVEK